MIHYVCPKCGGRSDTPKNCDTEGCPLNGQPLKECHCGDDAHAEVMEKKGQE